MGNAEHPFIAIAPKSILARNVSTWLGPIYESNRTNCELIFLIRTVWLNWIAWNRNLFDNYTVLTFKLRTHAKLNCLKWNCFWYWNCTYTKLNFFYIELFCHLTVSKKESVLILNWISWIRIVWINWIAWNRNVFTHAKLNC